MTLIGKVKRKLSSKSDRFQNETIIKDCRTFISIAKQEGIDTTRAEKLLGEAKIAFSIDSEKSGIALVKKAKQDIQKKINLRDKARMRVMLSNRNFDTASEKIKLAKERYGLSEKNSKGIQILRRAEKKRNEGDYSTADALIWRGENILEEEIKNRSFSQNCNDIIDSQIDLFDHLTKYGADIKKIENKVELAQKELKNRNYKKCISITAEISSQLKSIFVSNEVDFVLEGIKDTERLTDQQRKLEKKIKNIEEEMMGFEDKLTKGLTDKKIRETISEEGHIERKESDTGLVEEKDLILNILGSSPRIETEYMDLSSESLIVLSPSFSKADYLRIGKNTSFLNWIKFSPLDFQLILDGVKMFDDMAGLKNIILLDGMDRDNNNNMILFSDIEKNRLKRRLSNKVKENSYIDNIGTHKSLFHSHLSEDTEAVIFDVSFDSSNTKNEITLYKQLIKDLI